MLSELRRLRDHLAWADEAMIDSITQAETWPADAAGELGHVLASQDTWLARLEGRAPTLPLWPSVDRAGLRAMAEQVHLGYLRHLEALTEADVHRLVHYQNSAGISFETSVRDILHHVFMHAQYHRGKVNLLLRQAGLAPVSVDYIAYVRGFPTAVTPVGSR